ncbi:MAG: formate dehydrogenase subunit gamma, partial [bacterium]
MKNQTRGEGTYLRFDAFHRWTHGVVIVSFILLALTGLPLKFSGSGWAIALSRFLGGFETAGFVHRVCGLITFGYFGAHIGYLIEKIRRARRKGGSSGIFKLLLGPDSLAPRLKDIKDIFCHFRWFLGLGPRPKWERWTYWEKFDYWAVFWGVTIIGWSGLILWFPTLFSKLFPGWIFNVAMIVHSDEALLATGFIFTIHFFNTHLRPDKFPMDPVIFTGRISKQELMRERPLQYERLLREGRLDELRTDPVPLWLEKFSRVVGFVALGVGIILIVLM